MTAGAAVATLLLAVAIDLAVGDPPNRWHPVAGMGALLAAGRRRLARGGPARLLVAGALLTLAVAGLAGAAGWIVERATAPLGAAGVVLRALALTSLLSVRGLVGAARLVGARLAAGDLGGARAALGEHLVSRPTATLDPPRVASGAIESVAENLTDALVAPAACFLLLGLPGAAAYRAVNTADAMLGYREGVLEWFGKAAARLDDVLNLVPARLAALAIVAAAALGGASAGRAFLTMCRDARRTASPNAGWTMAAMAGALGVVLEKPGVYRLGRGRLPAAGDVPRALRVAARAAGVALAALVAARMLAR
jgi:adenosylcobinamide-phosphate synthase